MNQIECYEKIALEAADSFYRMNRGFQDMIREHQRPSVLYRPTISQDGDAFIALLGENIQEGVVGCGDTPEKAMMAFDSAWYAKAKVSAK